MMDHRLQQGPRSRHRGRDAGPVCSWQRRPALARSTRTGAAMGPRPERSGRRRQCGRQCRGSGRAGQRHGSRRRGRGGCGTRGDSRVLRRPGPPVLRHRSSAPDHRQAPTGRCRPAIAAARQGKRGPDLSEHRRRTDRACDRANRPRRRGCPFGLSQRRVDRQADSARDRDLPPCRTAADRRSQAAALRRVSWRRRGDAQSARTRGRNRIAGRNRRRDRGGGRCRGAGDRRSHPGDAIGKRHVADQNAGKALSIFAPRRAKCSMSPEPATLSLRPWPSRSPESFPSPRRCASPMQAPVSSCASTGPQP